MLMINDGNEPIKKCNKQQEKSLKLLNYQNK